MYIKPYEQSLTEALARHQLPLPAELVDRVTTWQEGLKHEEVLDVEVGPYLPGVVEDFENKIIGVRHIWGLDIWIAPPREWSPYMPEFLHFLTVHHVGYLYTNSETPPHEPILYLSHFIAVYEPKESEDA